MADRNHFLFIHFKELQQHIMSRKIKNHHANIRYHAARKNKRKASKQTPIRKKQVRHCHLF